jgi:hypothetical protein
VRVKPRFGNAIALDSHRDAHEVAALGASGSAAVWVVLKRTLSARRAQMFGERPH